MNLNNMMPLNTPSGIGAAVAIRGAGGYLAGYIYGAIFDLNRHMAAKAVAIGNLAYTIFEILTTLAFKDSPKAFHATYLLGTLAFMTAQIVAFRKLNLIAGLGTGVLVVCTILASVVHLYNLDKALDD